MDKEHPALVRVIFLAILAKLEKLTDSEINISQNEDGSEITAKTTNAGIVAILSTNHAEIQCNYEFPTNYPETSEKHKFLQDVSRPGIITPKQFETFALSGNGINTDKYAESIAVFLIKLNLI